MNMPALGASGPYRAAAGYGSIIEGMGGFAARFGWEDEGARVSQTFYPDPVAGIHGVVAVLTALAARDHDDIGAEIDLSQQETLWLLFGESIVAASGQGRDVGRLGNREPGVATSGVFLTADGDWVAVVSQPSCDELVASSRELKSVDFVRQLRAAGGRAEIVLDFEASHQDPRMAPWLEEVVHPLTGTISSLRVPLRVDGTYADTRRPAPVFDQHTEQVLSDWLQCSDHRMLELRGAGVLGRAREGSS